VEGPTAGHFVYPSKTPYFKFLNKGALTMETPKGGKQSFFVQPSKLPVNKPSSRFPNRSIHEKRCPSLGPFLLSKFPVDEPSSRFLKKTEPLCREIPVYGDFSKYPSGSSGGSASR
jgi:hypothetical protein